VWGKESFLLAKYHEELLLIGCTARFDNKGRHFSTWCSKHRKFKKEVCSIVYSTCHCPFNQLEQSGKEIDLFQDGGKIKKEKNIDHHGTDQPTFPLVPTSRKINLSGVQGRRRGRESQIRKM
jgi:hypothetical protein